MSGNTGDLRDYLLVQQTNSDEEAPYAVSERDYRAGMYPARQFKLVGRMGGQELPKAERDELTQSAQRALDKRG